VYGFGMFRYVVIFLVASCCLYFYQSNSYNNDLSEHLKEVYNDSKKHYKESLLLYKINSDTTFENLINVPHILNILKDIDNKKVDTDALRKKLHSELKTPYENLKKIANVRQLHFHHKDGRSFLRMHRPSKYGDSLFDIRHTIKLANTTLKFVEGFEEGRIFNGYRFVYPIIYQQKHLGSVEISISMDAITDTLKTVFKDEYCFLLDTETINKKLFNSERSNYITSQISETLSIDTNIKNQSCNNDLIIESFIKTDKGIKNKIKDYQPVYESNRVGSDFYVLNMIPIKNIKAQNVAYLYTVFKDEKLSSDFQIHNYTLIVGNLILFILTAVFYLFRRKQDFLKEQSEILEQQVQERTQTIELALQKEKYIKNLLETVFDVSEHITFSDKTLGMLSQCCERIVHHENYVFAYINFFENDQNIHFLSKQYKSGLNNKNIENIYTHIKNDSGIQESLQNGSVVIKNCTPDEVYTEFINSIFVTEEIKSMILIPIKDDAKYFGYIIIFSSILHDQEEEIIIFHELGGAVSKSLISLIQQEKNDTLQKEKIQSYKELIYALVDLTEKRDTYTAGHTRRVASYSIEIAKRLDLKDEDISLLEEAAMLHDIGKIVTPDSILLKPASLNSSEYNIIQDHVKTGVSILEGLHIYGDLLKIMKYHHEKYDGSGYPYGLQGKEIPLLSRIMTIADAFDAMTTNRIYKPRKKKEDAIEELIRCKGTHFDPELTDIAIEALKDIEIDFGSNQLPSSGPDYERLAYHFRDPLTELYNKNYLLVLLENGVQNKRFECLNIILLNNFHEYNSKYGWEAGNIFLKKFARSVEIKFPDSYLFRIFGDDFIILNFKHVDIDASSFDDEDFVKNSCVGITVEHHDMRDKEEKKHLINMLEVHI
jgi:putative nucleotidyltransferase with HDIG domain